MSNIRSKTLPSKSFKTESSQINSDIEPKEWSKENLM